ncbi:D-alanyl-D-alanine carboxypeptidase [Streptomyces antibioticus]|nr:D-alanyl-D-alanine carboxypeptidase [Streptomyces antibioticus]KUN21343.1 D-alanyl-D-alanine carboxypeptidase [Streptomyces antibioticus]
MAGESPDRSKQRESSAEPTSGSAGPVPEARNEVRDPRLAVARDTAEGAGSGTDAGAESRGGVDTATRVFSVRDVAKARESAARADAADAPEDAEDAGPGEGGDARLRAAVAAWVRSGDGTPEKSGEAGEAGVGVDGEAGAGTGADGETKADAAVTEADGQSETGADGEVRAGAGGESEAKAGPGADREVRAGADRETGAGADGKAGTEAEAKAGAGADGESRTQSDGETETDGESRAQTDGETKADVAEAQAAAETDAGNAPDAEDVAAEADGGRRAAEGPQGASTAAEEPETAAEAAEAAKGDAERDSGEPGSATSREPEASEEPEDTPRLNDEPAEPEDAPQPSDEPRDAVGSDQPTTMLKLPKAPAPAPAPTPAPGAAERTSKFVALKPDVTTAVPQVGPERTTQQPLPPKPPLDLLAELTNTPPPPETPLRTTLRRVKIWTPLVLLLAVVFAVVQSVRPLPTPTLQLTAEETYSFDGGKADVPWPATGQAALEVQGIGSFGSSGEQKPVPIASVAKVMTAYLILRDHPLKGDAKGPMIKVDQAAEDQASAEGESTVKVKAGDEISEREALQGILLASANNVARLVARWDAGSEKAFVAKMNAAAKDLGMTNTTYTDPSGLHDTTVSTAVDQVKLAKKAMQEPVFRAVVSMMEYYDYKGQKQRNWNSLVGKNGVIGIKTGTTTSARGNLVFAATKEINGETRTIFGAVLRQPEGGFDHTIISGALDAGDKLIRAAQENLKSATILKKGDVVGYVDDGLGGRTPVVATKDVTAVGWSGLTVKLTFAADDVPHTAKAGTKVGSLTVGDASKGAVTVPVALQKDLVEPGFTDKLTRLG